MDPEHQSILIGVIILLLIINTTVVFSLVSEKSAATPVQPEVTPDKSALTSPTVSPAANKTATSPNVTAKATTAAPKPGDTSKAVPAKTNVTAKPTATVKPAATANASAGFLKYSNTTYQFGIDYPKDWTVAEMTANLLKTVNASLSKKEPGITVVEF
jgi:hypothetical protein